MANRFICRKITVKSYSRQGWELSRRESYGVYDRDWKKFTHWYDNDPVKYVRFSEYTSKAFVQAVAKYLNEHTPSDWETRLVDGFGAKMAVMAAAGFNGDDGYGAWVEKFDPDFRRAS